eukprot:10788704-Alexandrium_andersonii.AAC.1
MTDGDEVSDANAPLLFFSKPATEPTTAGSVLELACLFVSPAEGWGDLLATWKHLQFCATQEPLSRG